VAAGFEIIEEEDLAPTADIPWWEPLDPQRVSVKTFRTTGLGRLCTKVLVNVLETLRVAPSGSSRVASFLERAGGCQGGGG
jgi:sterol 24-C-methyltransferase